MNQHEHSAECRKVLAQLYEYIDGELDEASRAAIREHLELCRPCLSRFEFEQLFHEYVKRQAPRPSCSEDFKNRLSARLRQERDTLGGGSGGVSGIPFNRLSRFALAASMVLVVGLGAWWMAHRSAGPTCDWSRLAGYHADTIEMAEGDEDGIETTDPIAAHDFIVQRLGADSDPALPKRLPSNLVTHEACMKPWKKSKIAQFEWRRGSQEISMFVAPATCLPITSEPKVESGNRCYRMATVNGFHALCWKDTCGYVCVMMTDSDFDTMLAWADELRTPSGY